MAADLHMHSTFSDGTYTPSQIVKVAKKVGLTTISITDHDTTAGVSEAQSAGQEYGVAVLAGVELTTQLDDIEIHMLGYGIDIEQAGLQAVLAKLKLARKERVSQMVELLKKIGVNIRTREVLREAKNECPGRPHVARVLVKEGFCKDLREAFQKYIGIGCPAYVRHHKLSPREAIEQIRQAGGISVLGHPAGIAVNNTIIKIKDRLPELAAAGLLGIEAFYPQHNQTQTHEYLALAQKYNLLPTGGSDFHGEGGVRNVIMGAFTLADEFVDAIKLKIRQLNTAG